MNRTFSQQKNGGFSVVLFLLFFPVVSATASQAVVELIQGSTGVNRHVFDFDPSNQAIEVSVRITPDVPTDTRFFGEWFNEESIALSRAVEIPQDTDFPLSLPASEIGYYGLRITEETDTVSIMGQDAGFYHELGVAVMPPPPEVRRSFSEDSQFGTVFGEALDPRIDGGFVKNMTWFQSPTLISDRFAVLAANHKRDILLLYKDDWDSDDNHPIPESQLALIDDRLTVILQELKNRELAPLLGWIQLDLEFNAGDWLAKPHGDDNLATKAKRVRQVLDREGFSHTRTVTHGRGWVDSVLAEVARHAEVVGPHVDCIGWSFYNHLEENPFPDPNGDAEWYASNITRIKAVIAEYYDVGAPTCFAILETGDANHGNHNPTGHWGYENKPYRGPDLLEHAIHRFKFSVIGGAYADMVIDYSYIDREEPTPQSITEAESFFGMYSYGQLDGNGGLQGPPKPAALAYANMRANLDGKEFQSYSQIDLVHSYVYGDPDTREQVHVVWIYPYDRTKVVQFDVLGIDPKTVVGAQDIFGKRFSYSPLGVEVNRKGVYIKTISPSDSDSLIFEDSFELSAEPQ